MLGHLIRKEILDHLLSLRFLILSGIGALIVWLSLYSGYTYYQARLKDYQLAQAATEERIQQLRVLAGLNPGSEDGSNWPLRAATRNNTFSGSTQPLTSRY